VRAKREAQADWRSEPWDDDGYWQGPRDLRVFLRANSLFATFWALFCIAFASAVIATETSIHGWYGFPFGVVVGGAAWLLFMFLCSHRLLAEGD
jgi:hypothetical protein